MHGGWTLLNREERIAFLFTAWLLILFTLLIGLELGHYLHPHKPIAQQLGTDTDTGDPLPNASRIQQAIAAARDDARVDRFCKERGFQKGYPRWGMDDSLYINCYESADGVDRSQQFRLFDAFANYVERQSHTQYFHESRNMSADELQGGSDQ